MSTKKKLLEAAAGNAGEAIYVDDVFSTDLWTTASLNDNATATNGLDLAGEGGMIWLKNRDTLGNHTLFDSDRGLNYGIYTDGSGAQWDTTSFGFTAPTFNSNGYTTGTANVYTDPGTHVGWSFRKQPGFFDIVTYTGNGGSNRAISHNLASKPGLVIIKATSMAAGWMVGTGFTSTQYYRLALETSGAASGGGLANYNNYLSAEPTTTTFSVGNEGLGNANGQTYVAYLFANDAQEFGTDSDESVIKCGSFTTDSGGNATVDVGFEPQFILIKRTDSARNWHMVDVMRGFGSTGTSYANLIPNLTNDEGSSSAITDVNTSGFTVLDSASATYIYMAIRRPNKPASEFAATDLFNTVQGASSTANPGYNLGIAPDMAWQKAINNSADGHYIGSRMTGSKYMFTNSTASEATGSSIKWDYMNGWVDYFSGMNAYNAWGFKRAPGFFDVVTYDGFLSNGASGSKAHNLNTVPEMMIFKNRSSAYSWYVWHKDITALHYIRLNEDYGETNFGADWASGDADNIDFGFGHFGTSLLGESYVAYLFASTPGICDIGSYTGNGGSQDINCGFTNGARFVLIKCTSSGGAGSNWYVWDYVRGIGSGNDPYLALNTTVSQEASFDALDTLPAGFTIKQAGPNVNQSGGTYIYMAIA